MDKLSSVSVVSWIVILILFIFAMTGLYRGFIRTLFSTFALAAAITASVFLTPLITPMLQNTPVYSVINNRVEETLQINAAEQSLQAGQAGGGAAGGETGLSIIQSLPLPDFLKDQLGQNHGSQNMLQESTQAFQEYIAGGITKIILAILVFIILFIIIFIILKIIAGALDLLAKGPVLGALNRFGGLVFGVVNGWIFLNIVCSVLSIAGGSQAGSLFYDLVSQSDLLAYIYDHNLPLIFLTTLHNYLQ